MTRKGGWIRRITAALLCVSLFLTCSSGVFAASDQSANLEKAILAVKAVVDIPEDYQFEYHSYENEVDGKRYTQWELRWYDENFENSIHANVNQDFQIVEMDSYSSEEQSGIGTISRSDAAAVAMDFLKKAIPGEADRMREEAAANYHSGDAFYFYYSLYENGIPAPFKTAAISVNKFTGKVESFYREGYDVKINSFPGFEGAMDLKGAKAAYLKEYGMKLQYNLKWDYQNKTIEAIPAYVLEAGDGKAIDALTGASVELYEDNLGLRLDNAAEAAAGDSGGRSKNQLSEAELVEVQNTDGLLSKSQALTFVEKQVPNSNISWKGAENANLTREYFDGGKYRWSFSKEDVGYAAVDARTGELLSFSAYQYEDGNKNVSYETAKKEVESFLKSVAGEAFAQSKFSLDSAWEESYAKQVAENDERTFEFQYIRQVNDADVNGNGLSVSYDRKNGRITYYDKSWDDNVTFPSLKDAISEEAAMEKAAAASEFQMMYLLTGKNTAAPVYYSKKIETVYLDPITGSRINYDGAPYKGSGVMEYSDISGRWYEGIVNRLLENGYYMEREAFDGAAQITQEGFLRYLYSPIQSSYADSDSFYERMVRSGVIQKDEINPEALLARQDAAKFVIRSMGLEAAASHPEIYQTMFRDSLDEGYQGYAALAYALKIFNGDESGNFNGGRIMTNAEAAVVIYQYLNVK